MNDKRKTKMLAAGPGRMNTFEAIRNMEKEGKPVHIIMARSSGLSAAKRLGYLMYEILSNRDDRKEGS